MCILAWADLDSSSWASPDAMKVSGTAHANLILMFVPEFLGVTEYMVGKREIMGGKEGTAQRI